MQGDFAWIVSARLPGFIPRWNLDTQWIGHSDGTGIHPMGTKAATRTKRNPQRQESDLQLGPLMFHQRTIDRVDQHLGQTTGYAFFGTAGGSTDTSILTVFVVHRRGFDGNQMQWS